MSWCGGFRENDTPLDVLVIDIYTLLLGNGRDLITVDAAVQFRIADAARLALPLAEPGRRAARHRLPRGHADHGQPHARRGAVGERRDH